MIRASTLQLIAGIFGAAVGAARKRRGGIGHARNIGIADQRKNRMIKRSGADFDLATLGRVCDTRGGRGRGIRSCFFSQRGFVFFGEVLPFGGELANDIVGFEPGSLPSKPTEIGAAGRANRAW